ncbi:MAG: N-acetylmuramidase family protein, partial [Xanthomonadales bacterium]|nr:N-acetylmuramidase family protein [Xanthomonadales bacterium]
MTPSANSPRRSNSCRRRRWWPRCWRTNANGRPSGPAAATCRTSPTCACAHASDQDAAMTPITPAQWQSLSERLDLSVPTLKAVAEVESAGSGFLSDGRPKILFEGHVFSRLTKRAHDAKHPTLSHKKWTRKHYLGGVAEWTRLEAARALDFDTANQSASWGAFQIMGFNHRDCG